MPWIGVSPEAAGKSSIAGFADRTRRNAAIVALDFNTISTTLILRIRRTGSGRGTPSAATPKTSDLDEDGHRAKELRRPPMREGRAAATTHHTAAITASMTTPAEIPPNPTLCTSLDLRIPHPPAAEATAGGGGIRRSEASEVGRRRSFRNRLSGYCSGREEASKFFSLNCSLCRFFQTKLDKFLIASEDPFNHGLPFPEPNTPKSANAEDT
jgi:hypothetical protein